MLKIKSLYVSFTKEYYTLNDISLELSNGERLTIIGSKESGRTAFLRTLVGLEPMAKGEIFYNNIPLNKVDFENDISLGYIPTIPAFIEGKTVKDNIEYVVKLRTKDKSLISVKTQNALLEYGLDFIKNKKVKELSYFDRIKLSIARLSTRNIDLFLIDDIFTKLSSMEKDKAIKMIKTLIKSQSAGAIIMTDSEEVAKSFGYNKKYLIYGNLNDQLDTESK
ncbi:MAG: ATP-binding cassette domain-containing protein [Christensenellales bacterium]